MTPTLGDRIRQARGQSGLTADVLCDRTGLHDGRLLELETGTLVGVSAAELALVARALEVTIDSLVWGSAPDVGLLLHTHQLLLDACRHAYQKHCLDDDAIGWQELGETLQLALSEAMGTAEFSAWVTARRESNG